VSRKTTFTLVILLSVSILSLTIIYNLRKQNTSKNEITEVNILISLGGDNTHKAVFERYINAFNRKDPSFQLKPYYVASDVEAMLKLIYATSANKKYDIACLSANQIYSLCEQNLIEPIEYYIEEDLGIGWISQLPPVYMAHAVMDGHIWSIPFLRNARVVLYNREKINFNKSIMTIEEVLEYAEAPDKQGGKILIPLNTIMEYISYQDPFDDEVFMAPGKYLNILDEDKINFVDRIKNGIIQNRIEYYQESISANNKLTTKDFGMLITSSSYIESVCNEISLPLNIVPLMLDENITFPLITSNLFMVRQSNSQEYQKTWEAIRRLWDIITSNDELRRKDHLPLTENQINQIRNMKEFDNSLFWQVFDIDYNGYSGLAVSQKSKIDLQIETVLTSILNKKLDTEQELQQLQQRIDTILSE